MKLGTMVPLGGCLDEALGRLVDEGFNTCQLKCWDERLLTPEYAKAVKALVRRHGVLVSAFWCGWPGPCEWNLAYGPATVGLVPAAYRQARLDVLKRGSDFSAELGVEDVVTHVGFIPNNPFDAQYGGLVGALRHLARYCGTNGQHFLFETGQEAPVVLLRTMQDVGEGNLGVNLDPANLLLYGMGNPVDALDVFGSFVRNVHAKDGRCPVDARGLGGETKLGQGSVNYPVFIKKLKQIGYDRYITIEREISGEEQIRDIRAAKILLEMLWAES